MKKIYLLLAALLVLSLTSMMLIEKNDQQKKRSEITPESKPLFHKGMITNKVKKGVGEFDKQRGNVTFNIASLDAKANRYEVDRLEKRFRYNPQKLRDGLPDLSRIYRIEFLEKYSVKKVAEEFSKDPNIEYAEPIPVNYLLEIPNDPMYSQLHHLPQIFAPEAWNIHKGENGTEEVVIAIVDTGVDWDHEDLVDNIWQNMGEDFDGDGKTIEFTGGEWIFDPDDENGVDDDGNGYIDDFIGWSFYFSSNDPNSITGGSHGTHCAGLASATTNNNIGVASISWNLKILPVQASDLGGGIFYGIDGIIYAAENGADVISNSWGADYYSQANHEVITYATGLGSIIIAAAGNDSQFSNHNYPSGYPGVISVAAVNSNDLKASFSNYGPNIWISSPGVGLKSTTLNNTYQSWSGTSMATPVAAGLLGLVKSYHPDWSSDQVITQVLGTADPIDLVNPGFENLLGSGRINALRALSELGILEQEISIDLIHSSCHDADSNNMLEPGDTVSMSFKLRNYNYGVGADNATFTLTTEDPDIIILNNSCSGTIPADNFFTLENVFQFRITDEAVVHLVNFKLITNAEVEITWGDTISFEVMVAPEGILVYQGEGTSNAFSGDYIYEFLIEHGLQVLYTSNFPSSLNGFDAVFLSYGNYGMYLSDGEIVTMEMTEAMTEYLINGGKLYAECGSFFGIMAYFEYPNLEEVMELFGVEEVETPVTQNNINLLFGIPNSICQDLVFSGSSQSPYWYIDKITPNENGLEAFEEYDYGTVAIQGEGEYGQKTFCFSYALAKLIDNEGGTRDTLMNKIVDFFDLYDPVANFTADTTVIVEGDTVNFTDLSENSPISWKWEFEGGTPETSTEQNPVIVYNTPGIYMVTLTVLNDFGSDTLSIPDYISVGGVGVIPLNSSKINIYPNPAKGQLFITSKGNIQSVDILNISGQVVKSQECNTKQIEINIAHLSEGFYFVRLKLEDEIETAKVIVMR